MMRRVGALALASVLGGCTGSALGPQRYAGPAPACGRNEGGGTTATLTRNGTTFAFAPYDGSLVVTGTVGPGGALSGTLLLRPASTGVETTATARPAQTLSAAGRVSPDVATVSYAAPGCTATVTLPRARPPLL